jgi:hypothetical protein
MQNSLKDINEVSRQILSQLDLQQLNIESEANQKTIPVASPETADSSQYSDEKLLSLVIERNDRINQLFEKYSQEQLNNELPLINEMLSFDRQLTSQSQLNKSALSNRVLTLRKSNKVANLYKKY